MADEIGVILAQTENTTDAADDAATTDNESTDAVTDPGNTETEAAEGDKGAAESGTDDAVEGDEQSSSSETYADFNLPEGVELNSELLEQALPLFKELKLDQASAQKIIDFEAERVKASQDGQAEAFNQLKANWQEQAKGDSEIGGDKFDQSVSDAREALGKFGTPELTKLLNDFGMGNHPEIIRFMSKVGALTKEDVPGSTGAATSAKKDRVSLLYPDS